jgi:hypothetical protein
MCCLNDTSSKLAGSPRVEQLQIVEAPYIITDCHGTRYNMTGVREVGRPKNNTAFYTFIAQVL